MLLIIQVLLFVLGFTLFLACNSEKAPIKQETTTVGKQKTSNQLSRERLEELRTTAKENKNINLSDVFVKRGGELAAKYCQCGEQKDIQGQKSCRSRLEQTYKTIDNRLEKERKAAFAKAYEEGKKACK